MIKQLSAKDSSLLQEREIAKALGGRVQSNSGGTKFGGGDVHTDKFLIEAKTVCSDKERVSIQKEWLCKAKQQAFEQNKEQWALAFRFEPTGPDFYVIDARLMKALIEFMEGEEG